MFPEVLLVLAATVIRALLTNATNKQQDGSRKKSAEPFSFFHVEDEGVGEENGHVDDDGDELMAVSKSPTATPTTTQTNYSRKHGRDDGINGISSAGGGGGIGGTSHKRRKRVAPGLDGDTPMTGGFPETPVTPVEEPRVTNGCSVGVQVEDIVEITGEDSIILGQEGESIRRCAWNPVHSSVLATASEDSIARIWNVPMDATPSSVIQNQPILHYPCNSSQKEVTAIRWSPYGDILATGSFDGQTRIWTTDGKLRFTLPPHQGPITALKWNKSADTLLSLSCDGKIIAWDVITGDMRRIFEQLREPAAGKELATDMDWVGDRQFAMCGSEGSVCIYGLEHGVPMSTLSGHSREVNCVVWDEDSDRLASGGVDGAVLVWNKPAKCAQPAVSFQEHTDAVVSLRWQPSSLSSPKRILASASNDCQIRLWDVVSGTCVNVLRMHIDPVEKISFSPDGNRLASGANGKVVIWNADTGAVTHVYDGLKGRRKNATVVTTGDDDQEEEGEIGEISWDEAGVRVAVGDGKAKVHIFVPSPTSAPTRC